MLSLSKPQAFLPITLAIFSVSLFMSSLVPAHASSGAQYVALRRKIQFDRRITLDDLMNRAHECVGKVMELRGTVGGVVETAEGLSMMLNLPESKAVTLDVPKAEIIVVQKYSTPTLRVLVRIGEGLGNVAPLEVLAIAHDSLVSSIETQEAAKDAARRRAQQQRQLQRQQASTYRPSTVRSSYASRGGAMPPNLAIGASNLTAYYQPRLRERARPLFPPYYQYIGSINSRLGAEQIASITYHLLHFADQNNIDPRLVVAMIFAESHFNPNATSRSGAAGLGQLMPRTAASLGVNNPYDHVQNLDGSIRYLRSRLDTFADKALPGGGLSFDQITLALAAYNAGSGAVKKYKGVPPYRETQAYVKKIISMYRYLIGE